MPTYLYETVPSSQVDDIERFEVRQSFSDPVLEVHPTTGRPHQIRAQLAAFGCKIRGDVKYGAAKGNSDGSICLHCRSMRFIHPVTKVEIEIVADIPKDPIWGMFAHMMS